MENHHTLGTAMSNATSVTATFVLNYAKARVGKLDPKSSSVDIIRICFEEALNPSNNYLLPKDENLIFSIGLAVAQVLVKGEDKYRLEKEVSALKAVHACISGLPIDFDRVEMPESSFGLMAIFNEAKQGSNDEKEKPASKEV